MRAALHGSYVEYVIFMGVTERYPLWFKKELDRCAYTDESRLTFWVNKEERRPDYYEKQLIEEFSVILKKPNGDIYVTDYDVFQDVYIIFSYDGFTNSGIAAFEKDTIEYVECGPGVLRDGYPWWFYEFFTESINLPNEFEGFMLFSDNDVVEVLERCAVLRNTNGEIYTTSYDNFKSLYDDKQSDVYETFIKYNKDNIVRPVSGGLSIWQ